MDQIGPLFVFINKVLLAQATPTYSHIIYGCFCAITIELNGCDRDSLPTKPKIFTLYRKYPALSRSWLISALDEAGVGDLHLRVRH